MRRGAATRRAPTCLLEVCDVEKRFGDKVVLDGVSLRVERGETVVIVGASGCGKTTLARLMIGLDRPTSGRIVFDGFDLAALPERELMPLRSRFGMVFQRAALLDSLSVYENVAFPLREETDLDEDAIRERVTELLEELGVAQAAQKLPGELSGGMAKRVGIARAMATHPEVLVCDEPTSGLDPITSRAVDGLIERMRERFFVTSIVVTHDMVTAYEIADRVVFLAHGRIVADGPPDVIFPTRRISCPSRAPAAWIWTSSGHASRASAPPRSGRSGRQRTRRAATRKRPGIGAGATRPSRPPRDLCDSVHRLRCRRACAERRAWSRRCFGAGRRAERTLLEAIVEVKTMSANARGWAATMLEVPIRDRAPASVRQRLGDDHHALEDTMERMIDAFAANDRVEVVRLWTSFESRLASHLAAEEEHLLPLLQRTSPRVVRTIHEEHRHIRSRVAELGLEVDLGTVRLETARAFVEELRAHARAEDRLLYAWADEHLGDEARAILSSRDP